jgi:hypothetical protein
LVGADSRRRYGGVVAMSRYRGRFYDPIGERHGGLPTWPWRCAPANLLTRRQLTARGLRPGGQPIAGQIIWVGRRKAERVAYLYDVALAKPKRQPSAGQRVALGKAMAARRTCSTCELDVGYCIPRSLGECLDCHDAAVARIRGAAA